MNQRAVIQYTKIMLILTKAWFSSSFLESDNYWAFHKTG